MANPYATLDDLGAYLGAEPPADAQRLLARAQDLIDGELISSYWTTDANGNPTDPIVIAAFNKATCQQAEWWIANGDEFQELDKIASYAIEGISVTRSAESVRRRLCDRAIATLRGATTGTPFTTAILPGKPSI